jgi:hypothetical protein
MNLSNIKQKRKGLINAYICPDLHSVVTKNVDEGMIPNEISCPQCAKPSISMMYQVTQTLPHRIEWFKPTDAEVKSQMLSMTDKQANAFKEYINNGGMANRLV